ncbi:hypothetical protein AGOR_G00045770 [Albula goreensis]|uniref:UmuC domain-containing protein n=1 Tax=Albula goreensis TaxID=1534307 RepID=A0A8T3DVP2_9TELE|nr:hypothetical protein AGOR_G00045770 [Albula goreensis]
MSLVNEDESGWVYQSEDTVQTETSPVNASISSKCRVSGTLNKTSTQAPVCRIILHFDLDCFYAQVEMIRNPELRNKPLGIVQKYIVVTCNYLARAYGVTKLMSVADAKEKCPQLVLVYGEDLDPYREFSYKVTELLEGHCLLVERLGFDENFMDVTDIVDAKMKQEPEGFEFSVNGHIYNQHTLDTKLEDHRRLAVGSHIAAELREAVRNKLGLTGCAGIATSKVLAKLVSGTFKPNQQTTLLPESTADLMSTQGGLRKVPGVGRSTAQRLKALGLTSVKDLQCFPLASLEKEFGAAVAQRLHDLSLGIDKAPVKPSGPPQSISDEDSFKKVSNETEVLEKVHELLSSLVERMYKDGRQPGTIRLTVRRLLATKRESRQCPIPSHIGKKIFSGSQDAKALLVSLAMKLFRKLIGQNTTFHLTLISVCFCNLQSRGSTKLGSIGSFFTHQSPEKPVCRAQSHLPQADSDTTLWTPEVVCDTVKTPPIPPGVDPSVFRQLPDYIQRELTSAIPPATSPGPLQQKEHTGTAQDQAGQACTIQNHPPLQMDLECEFEDSLTHPTWNSKDVRNIHSQPTPQMVNDEGEPSGLHCSFHDSAGGGKHMDRIMPGMTTTFDFPPNVDPTVFSELPAEVQREFFSEWRQQKSVAKIPSAKKQGRSRPSKEANSSAAKGKQTNNLLKYFKPR